MTWNEIKSSVPGRCLFAYLQGEYGANAGVGKCLSAAVIDIVLYGTLAVGILNLSSCIQNSSKFNSPKKQSVVVVPYGNHTSSQSGIAVTLGDIDGDGLNDLVVGSPSEVTYFRNTGNGKFEERQKICVPYGNHTSSQSGIGVALGDVNNDKTLDLIVGSPSEVTVFVNKDGIFEELK